MYIVYTHIDIDIIYLDTTFIFLIFYFGAKYFTDSLPNLRHLCL